MKTWARRWAAAVGACLCHSFAVASPAIRVVEEGADGASRIAVEAEAFRAVALGETVLLELPQLGLVSVTHDRREAMPSGNLYWGGHLTGQSRAYRVDFAVDADSVVGTVNTPERQFAIERRADGLKARVVAPVEGRCGVEGDQAQPLGKSTRSKSLGDINALLAQGDSSAETATVDVAILYTPGVAALKGAGMQQYLDQIWGYTRGVFSSSDTKINARLVGSQLVDYRPATSSLQTIIRTLEDADQWGQGESGIQAPPAGLTGLYQTRARLGADLVVLLVEPTDMPGCTTVPCGNPVGIAGSPTIENWQNFPDWAGYRYVVVQRYEGSGDTIAHELGHALGADHQRRVGCGPGALFPYSCAFEKVVTRPNDSGGTTTGTFGTAVTTVVSGKFGVFSNPSVGICDGPCGAAEGSPNSADNARTLRKTRFIAAKYMATAVPETVSDATGMWWVPAESGWGMTLTQRRDIVFAAWYTYDRAGEPKWYVASDCRMSGSTCTGKLYATSYGGAFNVAGAFDPARVGALEAGSVTIDFSSDSRATLTYDLAGARASKSIERWVFREAGQTGLANWSGLWNNAQESGWGITVTQQFDTLFIAWYTYAPNGQPIWYVASNCLLAASRSGCTGDLFATRGPVGPESTPAFSSAQVQARKVGTIALTFNGADSATVTYSVDGATGSRTISRFAF